MIDYRHSLDGITNEELHGFFAGWPQPPSVFKFREILKKSFAFIVAYDTKTKNVIGFVTAISDGIFAAFIPLLEVKTEYQRKGIGRELVRRMESRLSGNYSIDIVCNHELESFYADLGYTSLSGQAKRFPKSLS